MTNELSTTNNMSEAEYIASLNKQTNFSQAKPMPPILSFNGEQGIWYEQTEEKDAEGKPVMKPIGETVDIHIVNTFKMMSGGYNQRTKEKYPYYSREFVGNYVEIFNDNKEIVFKGFYNELKEHDIYNYLKFNQVLYAFLGDKFYRIKLSGSKLTALFPYINSFQNDSIARYITHAKKGNEMQNGAVKYFELNFVRGMELPRDLVIKRVNEVNEYIDAYRNSVNNKTVEATEVKQIESNDTRYIEEPPMPTDEPINVDNINF